MQGGARKVKVVQMDFLFLLVKKSGDDEGGQRWLVSNTDLLIKLSSDTGVGQ